MDVVVLALRVVISLGVVLALLFVLHRKLSRMNGSRAGSAIVSVVARQGIGAKASVVVLDAEGTRFYLGVTEQSVSVLHSAAAPRALQVVAEPDGAPAPTPALHAPETGAVATAQPLAAPRALQTVPVTPVAPAVPASDAGFAASLRLATSTLLGTTPSSGDSAVPGNGILPGTTPPPGAAAPVPGTRRAARAARTAAPATALQGSILSPATWKQTASFLRQGRAG